MSSDYLGGDSRLYFNQLGIWNLDHTSDVDREHHPGPRLPAAVRLRVPPRRFCWEYDSGAVEGVDKLDETYKLNIGYTW